MDSDGRVGLAYNIIPNCISIRVDSAFLGRSPRFRVYSAQQLQGGTKRPGQTDEYRRWACSVGGRRPVEGRGMHASPSPADLSGTPPPKRGG